MIEVEKIRKKNKLIWGIGGTLSLYLKVNLYANSIN